MKSRNCFIRSTIIIAVLFAIMLVFASACQSALACEPPTPVPPGYIPPTPIPVEMQVASVIADTQIVLDGTVKTWVAKSDMNSILTVQVKQYLKGHGPGIVQLSGYFWVCAPNFAFDEGSRAIFFVNGDFALNEPLQVRTWFDAQDAVIASVKKITGQEPRLPDGAYDALWLSLLVIVVMGLVLFLHYRRKRS